MRKILDTPLSLTVALEQSSPAPAQSNVTAEAKLTQGIYLVPGYTVQMQIGGGGQATFQGGGQTTAGSATNPLGRVDAVFSYPYNDSGTIQATATTDPNNGPVSGVQSPAMPYQFTGRALPKAIYLYPLTTCALADGNSVNTILAVVRDTNNDVYASYSGSLNFTVGGNANAPSPNSPVTNGFASETFTDGTQEDVTVTVTLSDYSDISGTQTISFNNNSWWDVQAIWSNGVNSEYTGNGSITASYQFNAVRNPGLVDLWICLDSSSNSSFDTGSNGYQNSKVLKLANAAISTDWNDVTITGSGTAYLYISVTAPGNINQGLSRTENVGTATLNLG